MSWLAELPGLPVEIMDAAGMMAMMRPAHFVESRKGDPEQLMQEFTEYVKIFRKFLKATGMAGAHTEEHRECEACQKAKALLELFGGK